MRALENLFFIMAICLTAGAAAGSEKPFLDWGNLSNPVLSVPDRMLKDQAVVYWEGTFYIFASNRFDENDPEKDSKEICFYRTRDFKSYECFFDADLKVPFPKGPVVEGSYDVTRIQGTWFIVFQAGPRNPLRLYYSTSQDLVDWAPARALAPKLQPGMRHIDGALAEEGGYFYLGYKGRQQFYVTRSPSRTLDGNWLPARKASADGKWAENFQFLKIDGAWRMVATGWGPGERRRTWTSGHESFLYTMAGAGSSLDDWTRWTGRTRPEIPIEAWNRAMHANSAYLCDWRTYDGYFYLFYAGCPDPNGFQGRGHGQIGVVRSRDLEHWRLPGDLRP